ncbi:MAG: hypothetical protein WC785_03390 [Tatlockia sp.]|jgi:hypothetical protein
MSVVIIMKRQYIKRVIILSLSSCVAFASPDIEQAAQPSLADHLHLTKDPIDGGWLPNLTGLPDENEIPALTDHISQVMAEDGDSACKRIDPRLKLLIFQHFAIHQQMANRQGIYFDDKIAYQWAHILAMILKESSGDSTNVTDMSGRSASTYKSQTSLRHWKKILNFSEKRIKLNYQTNFGLTQTSADRLFNAFHLAQNQSYDTEFLEGKEGASTPRKIALNTAIAIRRLIWFYQDFSQGRIVQSDKRIHQKDLNQPELLARYQMGLEKALLYCGTQFMFRQRTPQEPEKLKHAMATISYCKLGNSQEGYGKHMIDEQCFAEWVTLCPNLNIDIALLTPMSYFATRGSKPVCEGIFKRLINKKPGQK